MLALGATSAQTYWYLTRGTGIVALLLLTASVALGILDSLRFSIAPRWPRFAIDSLHRDISLLVIVLIVLHIVTSVLDGFAPITLLDGVVPFTSRYRPLWLGFGALSFDLLLAIAITSLVRRGLGYAAWRAVHWLAYASWPIAVVHGLGSGSDTKFGWMLVITLACVLVVAGASGVRIARSGRDPSGRDPTGRHPSGFASSAGGRFGRGRFGRGRFGRERSGRERSGWRTTAMALTIATPVGLAVFTILGPLQNGWARRAGTPASLLARPVAERVPITAPAPAAPRPSVPAPASSRARLKAPFTAALSGTAKQTAEPGGSIIDLMLRLSGGERGRLQVRLAGAPHAGGGLSLTGSQVDLLAHGLPRVLAGRVISLQGQAFSARVSDGAGTTLDLRAHVKIDGQTGNVTGTLAATSLAG